MWTETDEIFEEIDLDAFAESIQEIDLCRQKKLFIERASIASIYDS